MKGSNPNRPPPARPAPASERAERLPGLGPLALLGAIAAVGVLGIEVVWLRRIGLLVGRSTHAAAMVIAAYFVGSAFGVWWGGRSRSSLPLRATGVRWICAAGSALAGAALLPIIAAHLPNGPRALGDLVLGATLVPVAAMAAAGFPGLLSSALRAVAGSRTQRGAWIYAADLVGAAAGVGICGWWLPATHGYDWALVVAAGALALAGTGALAMSRFHVVPPATLPPAIGPARAGDGRWGFAVVIASGFIGLLLEILCMAHAALFGEETVLAGALVLGIYLLCLAAGSVLAVYWARRFRDPTRALRGALFLAGAASVSWALGAHVVVVKSSPWTAIGAGSTVVGRAAMLLLVFAPLLVPAAMIFPLAWDVWMPANRASSAVTTALIANKLAAATGALAAAWLAVPTWGFSGLPVAAGLVFVGLALVGRAASTGARATWVSLIAVAIAAAAFLPAPVVTDEGDIVHAVYQGSEGLVTVVERAEGSRQIRINGDYTLNGTGIALASQRHQSWLPMMLAPSHDRVCYVGLASGISAGAVLDAKVGHLDAVEIAPGVARAAREHFGEWNRGIFSDRRARIRIDDGRHVLLRGESYDLVIVDLFLPQHALTADLYSADFWRAVHERQDDRGACCLWLPLYQLDARLAGIAIRSFIEAFPCAIAIRGNLMPLQPILGLVGGSRPFDLRTATLAARLDELSPAIRAGSVFLRSPENLRLCVAGDLRAIRDEWSIWPLTTDARPAFAFAASRAIPPRERLMAHGYLDWFGRRYVESPFPSLCLDADGETGQRAALRAGNFLFAAAVSFDQANYATDAVAMAKRMHQAQEHLGKARDLVPTCEISLGDFGH